MVIGDSATSIDKLPRWNIITLAAYLIQIRQFSHFHHLNYTEVLPRLLYRHVSPGHHQHPSVVGSLFYSLRRSLGHSHQRCVTMDEAATRAKTHTFHWQ
jgi:hypothetical protein